MITHEQGNSAYGAGKASGEVWNGKVTKARVSKEFHHWLEYRRPTFAWINDLSAADLKQLLGNFSAGVKYGFDMQDMGPYRRNPAKPAGFKLSPSGTQWIKDYTSAAGARKKLLELQDQGYRANINLIGGKHRVVVGMDDPEPGYEENGRGSMRRTTPNPEKLDPYYAAHILSRLGIPLGEDFHTLSGEQVGRLLEEAKQVGYRKSPSAPGSTARMFHQYLQRLAQRKTKRNAGIRSVRKTKKFLKKLGTGIKTPLSRSRPATKGWGAPYTRLRFMNPTKQYKIRAASRIFTVSAKTKKAAQAEVQKYCRQHELTVRNPSRRTRKGNPYKVSMKGGRWKYFATLEQAKAYANQVFERTGVFVAIEATAEKRKRNAGPGSIRKSKKRTRAMGATHYQAGPYRGHQTKFKKFAPRTVRVNRKRVGMLVPRSTRRTVKSVERRTSSALRRYLGGRS